MEAEKAKFEEERKRLASKTMSEGSTTSTTSATTSVETSSLESSSSTAGKEVLKLLKFKNYPFKNLKNFALKIHRRRFGQCYTK